MCLACPWTWKRGSVKEGRETESSSRVMGRGGMWSAFSSKKTATGCAEINHRGRERAGAGRAVNRLLQRSGQETGVSRTRETGMEVGPRAWTPDVSRRRCQQGLVINGMWGKREKSRVKEGARNFGQINREKGLTVNQ